MYGKGTLLDSSHYTSGEWWWWTWRYSNIVVVFKHKRPDFTAAIAQRRILRGRARFRQTKHTQWVLPDGAISFYSLSFSHSFSSSPWPFFLFPFPSGHMHYRLSQSSPFREPLRQFFDFNIIFYIYFSLYNIQYQRLAVRLVKLIFTESNIEINTDI